MKTLEVKKRNENALLTVLKYSLLAQHKQEVMFVNLRHIQKGKWCIVMLLNKKCEMTKLKPTSLPEQPEGGCAKKELEG